MDSSQAELGEEFADRTVVVTGGARGLGLSITRMFTERGAAAAVIDVDADALRDAADGPLAGVHLVHADIRRRDEARAAFAEAVQGLGKVDILINNAGIYPRADLLEIDEPTWDAVFDVNLRGMYNMTATAVAHMAGRSWGRIVSISSIDAFIAYPQNAHYAAAKAGVISFTKSFAQRFAPDQILVNAVAPAAIATEKLRALGILDDLKDIAPLGRPADPDDIAEVVLFLASDRNRYITGETVVASGGALMV